MKQDLRKCFPCGMCVAAGFAIALLPLTPGGDRAAAETAQPCAGDNGGIVLPPGFCATVFADNIGHARQMAVAPNGVVYVNT